MVRNVINRPDGLIPDDLLIRPGDYTMSARGLRSFVADSLAT